MVELEISINDKKVSADLRALAGNIIPLALRPIHISAQWIAGQVSKKYLRGPRPERLEVDTARLRTSIGASAEITKKAAIGRIGTNVVSPRGFNYPKYWEEEGHKGVPRPFLKPARDDSREKWLSIFKKEYKTRLVKWLSGRASLTT